MIRKLYFRLLRKLNDGTPSKREVEYCYHNKKNTCTIESVMFSYFFRDMSIEDIAKERVATRERIRQILIKGCRL